VLASNLKEAEESLAFEKQMFGDLESKFMELQSKHTDAAAATFDPHLAGGQFNLVVNHHHVGGINFVEPRRFANGLAG
jgi:hypothetical protein